MSERQLFTFDIASNGCLHLNNNNNNNNCLKSNIQCIEIRVQWTVHMGYIVECRQHKHDNQSYDTLKSRSLAISTNTFFKVLKPIPGEHHK